jgi:hypothetical protein
LIPAVFKVVDDSTSAACIGTSHGGVPGGTPPS